MCLRRWCELEGSLGDYGWVSYATLLLSTCDALETLELLLLCARSVLVGPVDSSALGHVPAQAYLRDWVLMDGRNDDLHQHVSTPYFSIFFYTQHPLISTANSGALEIHSLNNLIVSH